MNHPGSLILSALAGISCCLFASCAGSADTGAMTPASVSASGRTGLPVQAVVTGGTPRSKVLANITNEDFKEALESSLVRSGLFKSAGGGGYQIDAAIMSIEQPAMGFSMRVNMEVNYMLRRNGTTVWRKSVKSTYVAPVGEAFVGAVRVRKATEGAARENIAILVRSLDEKL